MRSEAIGPRTWVLLALAGWAVISAGLALSGMGGRIAPLPDDPDLVQPLPALPASTPERLGPLDQYTGINTRPVFTADRQPHPFFLEGQGDGQASKGFDYVLTSVLITPRVRLAIVQPPGEGGPGSPVRVKLGEALASSPEWRLAELEPRQAVFDGPQGRRTLELRVFDGQGGTPPASLAGLHPAPASTTQVPPPGAAATPAPHVQQPGPVAPPGNAPAPANADAAAQAQAEQTPDQQMQAIRARIEARRQQLREQQNSGAPGSTK